MSDNPVGASRSCLIPQSPVMDLFDGGRNLLAKAPSSPPAVKSDVSPPPVDAKREEQYNELKAALIHRDIAEASRIDGKYHFSTGEKLAVCRAVVQDFFQQKIYEAAALVANWNQPHMETEYQEAFQSWYREKILSLQRPERTCDAQAGAVYFCKSGNALEDGRVKTACTDAYRQVMMRGNVEGARQTAEYCALTPEERKAPCPDAYRNVMTHYSTGHLDTADQIAAYCGWDASAQKTAIEGFVDTLAATNISLAAEVARCYKIYHKAQMLEEKIEAERRGRQQAENKKLQDKIAVLKKVRALIDAGNKQEAWNLLKTIHLEFGDKYIGATRESYGFRSDDGMLVKIGCDLMCNGVPKLDGQEQFLASSGMTAKDCTWSCFSWGKTEKQIADEAREVREYKSDLEKFFDEGVDPETEKRQRRIEEREKRERKAAEAAEAKRLKIEQDDTLRKDFISAVAGTNFEEAGRIRKEGGWSQKDVRSLVDRALKRVTTFPIDSCDRANVIYKEYKSMGRLCTPKRTSWSGKDGSCKLECD